MRITSRGLFATDVEVEAARWVQRKLGSCEHERRVLAIAAKLFEMTRPLLGLGLCESRLLRLGALSHDIGRSVSEKNHPDEGAKLILATTALDLSPFDRRALAFLARYHRGSVPPALREEYLRPLDARRPLRAVLGLLRVADALDSRRIESPRLLFSMAGRKLSIRCFVDPVNLRAARDVYRRRKKFHLLESFLGHDIDIEVDRSDALAVIAS
ncbi:MAG: HD domain-containing protein [Burkholderiales bacterium]|nr:HD domain-containing protein [Phycisphaerae bacterium]